MLTLRRYFGVFVLLCCARLLPAAPPAKDLPPRTVKMIADIQAVLGDCERAADEFEKQVGSFSKSANPNVIVSIDSAMLQIQSIRSIRKILAEQPDFVTWHLNQDDLDRWKTAGAYFIDCAKTGKDPFAGMTGGTRPFRSKIDGQLLLYQFQLPRDYDAAKKYPMQIELHAGGGFAWLESWVKGMPTGDPRHASGDGAIHIQPAGRQHVGMGEVAILDAIADAEARYSVDEDRLIIGGWSWGGTGGFHFGTLLPDHFAAAWSGTGGGNYNVPVGNGRFDAYLLSDNLCALPFWVCDTPGDSHYRANHAFADELRADAIKYPGSYPNLEVTDPHGGHGRIDKPLQQQGWDWMTKQVRNPYPPRVIYKTWCLRYDGAYWAHIDTVEEPTLPARIEAEITPSGQCRLTLDNADRCHLNLAPALVPKPGAIDIVIAGQTLVAPTGDTVNLHKRDGKWELVPERYPPGLIKKHGLSGPIQDVFMENPVLMVYGTAGGNGSSAATAIMDRIVARMFGPGDGSGFLRTGFDRKADTQVTPQEIAERNLILIGTPAQNRLLARISQSLPVTFLQDGIQIGSKEYHGPGTGLVMAYPNPLNPQRYILLVPEDYAGLTILDFPDYVVFGSPDSPQHAGKIVAQGTFDSRWQLKPQNTPH